MRTTIICITIVLTIFQSFTCAQSYNYWLHKYWVYRERFNKQFVRIGSNRGMSLPVSSRANQGEFYFPNGAYNNFHATGKIAFGDATIHLGYYIGTLATEYKLLVDRYGITDTQTRQTLRELGYALLTFDRLDCAVDGHLNGFFVRDDADSTTGSLFADPGDPPYTVDSDWLRCEVYKVNTTQGSLPNNHCYFGVYNSYDQMISLMIGLSLVYKFIPNGTLVNLTNVHDPCNISVLHSTYSVDIRNKAREIQDRIYNRLYNASTIPPLCNCASIHTSCEREIINHLVTIYPLDAPLVIFPESKYMWKAYNAAYQKNFNSSTPYKINEFYYLFYHLGHDYNLGLGLALAALSNNWHQTCYSSNVVINKIGNIGNNKGIEFYSLLRHVLHGGGTYFSKERYENILASAPCHGTNANTPGWCTDNRWESFFKNNCVGIGVAPAYSRYYNNGLDYMLLFNLYTLVYGSGKPYHEAPDLTISLNNTKNINNRVFPSNLLFTIPPTTTFWYGNNERPFYVKAGIISSNNTIVKTDNDYWKRGHVGFTATNSIDLENFEVEEEAYFVGEVKTVFECIPEAGVYGRITHLDNTTQQSEVFDDNTSDITQEIETSLIEENNSHVFKVYPNPSDGEINIYCDMDKIKEGKISIYNYHAQKIMEWEANSVSNAFIKKINLPQGLYIVKLESPQYYEVQKLSVISH